MSDFSAVEVAFTGIRFVRERPRMVAIWAGIQTVLSLVASPYIAELSNPGASAQHRDPTQALLPLLALLIPFNLALQTMLHATMARAVLRPSEDRHGYLRFGMDEARQGLLILLISVVALAAELLVFLATFAGVTVLAGTPRAVHPLLVVGYIAVLLAALAYFVVRLSLASALTYDRRKVDLFGSWKLTRGRFWKMLGAYALVIGLVLVIGLLTLIVTVAVGAVLGVIGAMAAPSGPVTVSLRAFLSPTRLGVSLIWALVTPLLAALVYMAPPSIYRQLTYGPDA